MAMPVTGPEWPLFGALAKLRDTCSLWPLVDRALMARGACFDIGDPERILTAARDVVLYGAGSFARAVLGAWQGRSVPVRYLVDSNPAKQGDVCLGYRITEPQRLRGDITHPLVVVAAMDTPALAHTLDGLGLPYIFAERDGSVGLLPGHILARRRADCDRLYELLADDRSRFVLLSVIIARLFQDLQFPMKGNLFTDRCASHPQYFPSDVLTLLDGERYVDCGAFDGDSLAAFAAEALRLGLVEWLALGIEADPGNAARARVNLEALGLDNIPIQEAVLGSGREEINALHLHNCLGGAIEDIGNSVALDDILGDFHPTFIKMDIEGAELAALAGASETIERYRPTLAVCTYHSTDELIDIPLFLLMNFPFYKLYLRHHRSGSLWETVCYAIPR